jgi:hypothetical protein
MTSAIELKNKLINPQTETIPGLWGRFNKVRRALVSSLSPDGAKGIDRDFGTFSWSGADQGIHDHSGSIDGTKDGVTILASIKGVTVDNNPRYDINDAGEWVYSEKKETNATIKGHFISKDGMEGAVEIAFKNGQPYCEAYWLSCLHGHLRLEQIVAPTREVLEAKDLSLDYQGRAKIPETNLAIPTKKRKQLTKD